MHFPQELIKTKTEQTGDRRRVNTGFTFTRRPEKQLCANVATPG